MVEPREQQKGEEGISKGLTWRKWTVRMGEMGDSGCRQRLAEGRG